MHTYCAFMIIFYILLCALALDAEILVIYEGTISYNSPFLGPWAAGDTITVTYTLQPGATAGTVTDGFGTSITLWGINSNGFTNCGNSSNATKSSICNTPTNYSTLPSGEFPFSSIQVCHASDSFEFAYSELADAFLGVAGSGLTGQVDLVNGHSGFDIGGFILRGFSHEESWLGFPYAPTSGKIDQFFWSLPNLWFHIASPFPNQNQIMDALFWTDRNGVFYDMHLDPVRLTIRRILYNSRTSPVPGCDTNGYDTVAPTPVGGYYPYFQADSAACRAWKLAATICHTKPLPYGDLNADFTCMGSSWGFTDPQFGSYCSSSIQYSCSTCFGDCNAGSCHNGQNTLRDCNGIEVAVGSPECQYSHWADWGECSTSCGFGTFMRSRSSLTPSDISWDCSQTVEFSECITPCVGECPPVAGYTVLANVDYTGDDIRNIGADIDWLHYRCDRDPRCLGFNLHGVLKYAIYALTPAPGNCYYVKQTSDQCPAILSTLRSNPSLNSVDTCDSSHTRQVLADYGCQVQSDCSLYVCDRFIPPEVIASLDNCGN